MKNRNKIIGILVAAGGVVASFGAATALYIKSATNTGFGIGAKFSGGSGTINYLIDGKSSGSVDPSFMTSGGTNGGEGLGGDYTQVHYSFPLSASYSLDIPKQPYTLGNFAVNFTNINEHLIDNSICSIVVSGYKDYADDDIEKKNELIGHKLYSNVFNTIDVDIDDDEFSRDANLCVETDGGIKVDIYFKLKSAVTGNELVSLREAKLFDLAVTWSEVSESFGNAYIISAGSSWSELADYAMYPNINKSSWEWMYKGLSGEVGKAKCKEGDNYSSGSNIPEQEVDGDGNVVLDSSKTYDVYWNGSNGSTAAFVVQE